jgi:tetratricopeptide (TPR) repeat protein
MGTAKMGQSRIGILPGALALLAALGIGADPPKPQWQRLLSGEDARKADALADQVAALQQAGKFADALKSAEALLQLRQERQGKDHWEVLCAACDAEAIRRVLLGGKEVEQEYTTSFRLHARAEALASRGRYREAQALVEEAYAIRRRVLGDDNPLTVQSCNNIAFLLNAQGKYAAAEQAFRKVLEGHRRSLGDEHPHTANSYNNLAFNHNCLGRYTEAEEGYRKALDIQRRVLGDDHPDIAATCTNLADNLQAQGKYAAAEEGFRKALAIIRRVYGDEHHMTARGCNNLAGNLHAQGQYAAAGEGYRRALDICRKVVGEEHPDTASSYNNLASTLYNQGKYAAAEEAYRKALDISRKILGEDHPDTANTCNNLAMNLAAQGRYAAAEEGFRKALEVYRKVLGDEHPHTVATSINLASNLSAQGKYAAAEEVARKALDICRRVLGEEHPLTATCRNNVSTNQELQGKYAAAEEGLQKTLVIRRKVLGEDHPDTARSYHWVARNLHAQGKYAEAEKLWIRGADAFAKARPRLAHSGLERATITGERSPLPHLAAVLARNGKPAAAWQRYEESLARGTWDDLSARLRRPPAEQARQAALLARLDRLDRLIEKAVANKDETPQQKERREGLLDQRRKAQEELDAFVRHLEETYGPAAGQVFDRRTIQAALAGDMAFVGWIDLRAAGPTAADPNSEHWAVVLRSQGEPIFERLRGSGPGGAWTDEDITLPARLRTALQERRDDWQRLARRLAQQRLEPLRQHLAAAEKRPPVRHLIVLPSTALAGVPLEVLNADATVSYASSGTLYAHLRQQPPIKSAGLLALGDPVFEAAPVKERPLPPGGVLLTVVQPGSNAEHSKLRPGDVLLKYGDMVLKTPEDLKTAVEAGERKAEVLVQVWRDGATLQQRLRPGVLGAVLASKPAAEALAERYHLDRALRSGNGEDWPALPGTRVEVESLRRLFSGKPEPKLLLDSQASEQRLDEMASSGELNKHRYVHLATHGEVDDAWPLRSALILSHDTLPDPQQQLLAGKPAYDGRLTAEEMLRSWHLESELVTLSACQTALGKYEKGEGFVGFAQALLLCGSRSVCLSLWKVDDAATALLMQRFYANLLGKREGLKSPLGKAEALREAKRWLRNLSRAEALRVAAEVTQGVERGKGRPRQPLLAPVPEPVPAASDDRPYAHPYYWAAFILIGDPY